MKIITDASLNFHYDYNCASEEQREKARHSAKRMMEICAEDGLTFLETILAIEIAEVFANRQAGSYLASHQFQTKQIENDFRNTLAEIPQHKGI